jgi:purine catabolism regulator
MVLERAAQALELGRMVERDRLGLELQAQGGLLADLAARRVDPESAQARARSLGLAGAPGYVPVVAHRTAADGTDPVAEHDRSRTLVEQLSRATGRARLSGLVGTLSGGYVGMLLAVPAGGPGTPPDDRPVLDALTASLPPGEITLGVGPVGSTVVAAGAGLRQARHVAEVASAMPHPDTRPYHRNSDVRLHGLMALLHDDPRVQSFVEAELAALLEHEAGHSSGLLELLRQYVAAGGNKTRLAAATHRSRPAVYKQLDRLERVLGTDLDDPVSLMSVGVALMAYDLSR